MRKKLCFVASSGGHWEELMCLLPLAGEFDACFVTEAGGQAMDGRVANVYTLPQINRREKGFLGHFRKLFAAANRILKQENPDVVITTGALIAYPFCLLSKLRGKKVIYIESLARVNSKSLTGRLVYPFADLFLVQWESMLKCYPKAKFVGGIF
ncbi:MAG: PssD/Cps14F family polysaccharide biosynthesis glycosyltransferase [Faecousia sp.]